MGIFRNLLKDVISTAKDVGKDLEKELGKYKDTPSKPAPQPSPSPVSKPAPKAEIHRTDTQWVDYFREILQTAFTSYTYKENVPVTELVGYVNDEFQLYRTRPQQAYKAEWGKPYSFVLYQSGIPRGIVMLGKGHSHDSNVKYLIARKYAQKMNLPYINFYTQMENERNYVIERIHKFGL